MEKILHILLNDRDHYFLTGLQHGLSEYFAAQNTQVNFFRGLSTNKPDIIFQAVQQGEVRNICRHFLTEEPQPLYFVIRDKTQRHFPSHTRCIARSTTLYRDQNMNDIVEKVKLAMQPQALPQEKRGTCPACHRQDLTERERQVLRYLRRGVSQSQIAIYLQLTVKTVHSHKRSAMKKLNFTRTNELFYWMLHGGLSLR